MGKKSLLFMLSAIMVFVLVLSACTDSNKSQNNSEEQQADNSAKEDNNEQDSNDAPSNTNQEAAVPTKFKESPMLADKGLPAVKDRLPNEPKLTNEMTPDSLDYEIGKYGGELRVVRTGPWDATMFILQNEPLLNSPGLEGKEVTGNVVKSYETNDQQTFTFHMREGLKWSDGEPVTTEDVRFAVEDVLFNQELMPGGVPIWLKASANAAGTPMKLEVIDEFNFRIIFDKPYGAFPIQLAVMGWKGYSDLLKPAHFLKKYHTKYTPLKDLEADIKAKKFEPGEWVKLFNEVDVTNWESPNPQAIGFPVLYPYVQTAVQGERILFERNPYYFKVDAEGNQLPYIDKTRSDLVQDVESAVLKIMAGEVDHSYEYVSLPKVPLLKENEDKGNYKVYMATLHRSSADIFLNMTYKDDAWRKVVRDLRFREALNLAMNKQEIADSVYYGFAKPSTIQDATFDIDAANKLLDDMGMKLGSDGYRTDPDGKKFSIPFEHGAQFADIGALGELLVEQWKAIGIRTTVKALDPTLWTERAAANQLHATLIWTTPGPVMWPNQDWGLNFWAPLWNNWWVTQGKEGEEPPADVQEFYQQISSFQQLSLQQTADRQNDVVQNVANNLWYFIPLEGIGAPVAVNADIGNFSDGGTGIAHNFGGEEWFFRK